MPVTASYERDITTLGEASTTEREISTVAKFGKCNMCSCPRYTTKSNDWQFCDCGHSRSQHQS
ncbi:hypothetical protein C8N24_3688 [Solirubrobacter pauli]|uniref:Uncharacterized protein n=1 Tax=Solirubrobacter pauli TaxID=166793 RepID=A0A660LK37_9ACTN|nr:hypothetical protein C8N24_3688 [Solirubrobacter pauli]